MARYLITHPERHTFGSSVGTRSVQYKMRSDIEARLFASHLMREHGWAYVTIGRKYKDTYKPIAKYTNQKFYVCFHEYFGGVFVASFDQTKEFGKDFKGAVAYAKAMNNKLNIHY